MELKIAIGLLGLVTLIEIYRAWRMESEIKINRRAWKQIDYRFGDLVTQLIQWFDRNAKNVNGMLEKIKTNQTLSTTREKAIIKALKIKKLK